ncbi:MAG: efflux RND transporter permease subunit [Acidobacteria bacterium]|nr:efflux RND transporter permease subunit [Acidobacteriota bacterium]
METVRLALRRPVTVAMAALALLIFGVVAFTRLPVNLLPDLTYPSLTVETRFPGAAPGEVEVLISRPVEEAVGVVSGVRRLVSISRPGLSQVVLEFEWGRNMDFAALDVRQKLDMVRLPREADKPLLLRLDPANEPVMRLYLTGDADLYRLRYVAEEIAKKGLESTEGVAAIKVNGGFEVEIEVKVDEGKLPLVGLDIEEVKQKLSRENVNQAGGSLYEFEARYLVRARNEFQDLEDIRATVLVVRDGRNVTLGDVAEVKRGHRQREVITRHGGRETVELAIYNEGDANTVSVARAVNGRLVQVGEELPDGIEIVTGADQSRFIQASIREVVLNAAAGGLIAVIVLLFFLKQVRSTLIIAISIPISIVSSFFLMYTAGISLNLMSLGGLALGVGLLVDNAIVVLEAIFKKRETGESWLQAASEGASEVGRAVVASTLTTVAVFLPVVFVEGIAAQIFRDLALTVSFSLIASLAVALTLIPVLSAVGSGKRPTPVGGVSGDRLGASVRFGAAGVRGIRMGLAWIGDSLATAARPATATFDRALGLVSRAYPVVLRSALRSRGLIVVSALFLLLATFGMARGLGLDLIPPLSQGEFSFQVVLPEGTPLNATDRFMQKMERSLESDPRVASRSTVIGGAGMSLTRTGLEGENVARLLVRMQPDASRSDEQQVAEALRRHLETSRAVRVKLERPTVFTIRTPIEVEVYSDDLDELRAASGVLKQGLEAVEGLVDVKSTSDGGSPELQVRFDREQLALLGLDLFEVAGTLRQKVQGEVATRLTEGDREIGIRVRSLAVGEASVEDVGNLIIGDRNGIPIRLKTVAEIELREGPAEIRRIGQKRASVLTASLLGRDMGSAAAEVRQRIRDTPLPPGVVAGLSGQEEERQRSLQSLLLALGLALFLVYLVMASQFESLLHPFVVMFTVPLGGVGAVAALALTGTSLSVVTLIGAVMLAGIVVNNAILLIDTVNQRRRAGAGREDALVQAGLSRLRPILMTSSTTILGLLPMALGLGEGAELRAPLAITVIGGLSVASVLTLIIIPVVYSLFDRKEYSPVAVEATVHPPPGVVPSPQGVASIASARFSDPGAPE